MRTATIPIKFIDGPFRDCIGKVDAPRFPGRNDAIGVPVTLKTRRELVKNKDLPTADEGFYYFVGFAGVIALFSVVRQAEMFSSNITTLGDALKRRPW